MFDDLKNSPTPNSPVTTAAPTTSESPMAAPQKRSRIAIFGVSLLVIIALIAIFYFWGRSLEVQG